MLFLQTGTHELMAIDFLGLLPKIKHGNRFATVITDGYSKLTKPVPCSETPEKDLVKVYIKHWIMPYGIPTYL